ncbi:[protein-PII] uridylyltransferase [Leeia sp. TBRC 13508]|uniref:Bifunctional uridylyltransferase/uridylyl-removing enzyme n=1 Tax=Leeia speluncae TaxID=2884804 RepID=A0ABS8D8C5_9NEIS|nr:[protein-PII] uridylyltransferase [Leeia speluncae]MCB6184463.1 [protein-PII] uridylyltransferase [Leeia speluncae]
MNVSNLPTEITPLRDWIRQEKQKISETYDFTSRPNTRLAAQSKLVDQLLQTLWARQSMPEASLLIAVGGYGRGQLYPFSDIDLLILVAEDASEEDNQKVEAFIHLLWDIGLEVGHSVRTLKECIQESETDITVQTSMSEARLLVGDEQTFHTFLDQQKAVFDPKLFFEAKLLEQQQRHAKYFGVSNNLEPNIKESPGGLRDLHVLTWVAHACGFGNDWDDLSKRGFISSLEVRLLKRAERVLQAIRIALHETANRREDRLIYDLQGTLAKRFSLEDHPRKRASEQLMQAYYRAARTIRQLNQMLVQRLKSEIFTPNSVESIAINERFAMSEGHLTLRDPALFDHTPNAILEAFYLFQTNPQLEGWSSELLRALWHARSKINNSFRNNEYNKQLFIKILSAPRGQTTVFRQMNQLGLLGKYIPAFGRIVGQMQHDLFHVYTVDEHILMVVRNLRRFAIADFNHEYPFCSRLMLDFEQPELLYLAGLFHDIAKGRGGDHSQLGKVDAYRFAKQHGFDEEGCELVSWLVENHLTMSQIAQKQDTTDPEVIDSFAKLVGTERCLTALYLLTVADIRGTSPKVWNGWKGKLLEDLYQSTRRRLGSTETATNYVEERQEEALKLIRLYAIDDEKPKQLWSQLNTVYFLRHDEQEIAWHARMLFFRTETPTPVVKVRLDNSGEGLQVLIYMPDQQDLFARICAQFEKSRFNIVNAKIFTTKHGYALDTFRVLPPADTAEHYRDLISLLEYDLTKTLTEETPVKPPSAGRLSRALRHFPISPQVHIRPDDRGNYYVMSIIAGDRPGLLSRVAALLVSYKISVFSARIATLGERVEDTFLIAGPALSDPKTMITLEGDLLEILRG